MELRHFVTELSRLNQTPTRSLNAKSGSQSISCDSRAWEGPSVIRTPTAHARQILPDPAPPPRPTRAKSHGQSPSRALAPWDFSRANSGAKSRQITLESHFLAGGNGQTRLKSHSSSPNHTFRPPQITLGPPRITRPITVPLRVGARTLPNAAQLCPTLPDSAHPARGSRGRPAAPFFDFRMHRPWMFNVQHRRSTTVRDRL